MPLRVLLFGSGVLLWLVSNRYFHVQWRLLLGTPLAGLLRLRAGNSRAVYLSSFRCSEYPERCCRRQLIYLGKISYGLYVFHLPCREVAAWLLGGIRHGLLFRPLLQMALTILVASLSYRYFEKPFLRLKARFEFIKTR